MFNKVAFLCVDPWEQFLSPIMQSHSRKYYELIKMLMQQKKIKIRSREYRDLYGESRSCEPFEIFEKNTELFQVVYIQSSRKTFLEKVFQEADMVLVGLPENQKNFEKIYLLLLPWKERILFLWNDQIKMEPSYLERLIQEWMLEQKQIIGIMESCQKIFGIKKAPELLQELMNRY